ncbi:MAG: chorismate synthase [Muribaculaceae bacterium]|nr:chorismate synthase [Muribaculaceae bacterium]
MNTFGRLLRLTTFGESHGPATGGVIDGLPPRCVIDMRRLQAFVARRRPGQSSHTTSRSEPDTMEFLSGILAWNPESGTTSPWTGAEPLAVTLGTPVAFMTRNRDTRSSDYDALADIYRPSHADFAWQARYGIRDWRGGGRSSGRETFSRVVAGGIALQLLEGKGVSIRSRIARAGDITEPTDEEVEALADLMRAQADSVGGWVELIAEGVPAGTGDPVFAKLNQTLASAITSIGAVKGVEFGMGFGGACRRGSETADEMYLSPSGTPVTSTNHSGGMQGGIANGMPILMRVAVKPTPTIAREMHTLDSRHNEVTFTSKGRHDPCILLRVRPVIESMAALAILDAMLARNVGETFSSF